MFSRKISAKKARILARALKQNLRFNITAENCRTTIDGVVQQIATKEEMEDLAKLVRDILRAKDEDEIKQLTDIYKSSLDTKSLSPMADLLTIPCTPLTVVEKNYFGPHINLISPTGGHSTQWIVDFIMLLKGRENHHVVGFFPHGGIDHELPFSLSTLDSINSLQEQTILVDLYEEDKDVVAEHVAKTFIEMVELAKGESKYFLVIDNTSNVPLPQDEKLLRELHFAMRDAKKNTNLTVITTGYNLSYSGRHESFLSYIKNYLQTGYIVAKDAIKITSAPYSYRIEPSINPIDTYISNVLTTHSASFAYPDEYFQAISYKVPHGRVSQSEKVTPDVLLMNHHLYGDVHQEMMCIIDVNNRIPGKIRMQDIGCSRIDLTEDETSLKIGKSIGTHLLKNMDSIPEEYQAKLNIFLANLSEQIQQGYISSANLFSAITLGRSIEPIYNNEYFADTATVFQWGGNLGVSGSIGSGFNSIIQIICDEILNKGEQICIIHDSQTMINLSKDEKVEKIQIKDPRTASPEPQNPDALYDKIKILAGKYDKKGGACHILIDSDVLYPVDLPTYIKFIEGICSAYPNLRIHHILVRKADSEIKEYSPLFSYSITPRNQHSNARLKTVRSHAGGTNKELYWLYPPLIRDVDMDVHLSLLLNNRI